MSYHEFSEFWDHNLAPDLYKRAIKLIRYFCIIYKWNQNIALFECQKKIFYELITLEHEISIYNERANVLKNEAVQMAKINRDNLSNDIKHDISLKYDQVKEIQECLKLFKYFRWVFRYIQDGIVWKAFYFNRQLIRALSEKEPVNFPSNTQGNKLEMNFFLGIRKLGNNWLPIMHDLSNCLRTGDFSIFKDGQLYRIIELKIRKNENKKNNTHLLGSRGSREKRQEKRLKNISEYMETGDLGKLRREYSGGKSIKNEVIEKHNYEYISRAISCARRRGIGVEEPESGLLYLAYDWQSVDFDQMMLQTRNSFPHIFDTPFTFRSFGNRNDEKPELLPITAMDLKYRDIVDLLFCKIPVLTFINFKLLEENAKEYKIPLHVKNQNKGFKLVVDSKPGGIVGEGLIDRLLIEALSMCSFLNLIRSILVEFNIDM